MNNKEIKTLMSCNDILTKECAKRRNENEELKNRLSTIEQQSLSGSDDTMGIADTKDKFIIGCLKAGHPIDNVKLLWLTALRKGNYAIPPISKEK